MYDSGGKVYLGHLGKVPVYAAFESLFLIFYVFYIGQGYTFDGLLILFVAIVLTILLHELGHALAALARGMSGVSITISALGGYCSYVGDTRNNWHQLGISFAGPAVNLLLALIMWVILHHVPITDETIFTFVYEFYRWNLILGILNSLPIYPLDGGQMALSISRMVTRDHKARRATLHLSFITALIAMSVLVAFTQHMPIFLLILVGFLLFNAYRDLR